MGNKGIIVYGAMWCPDCVRSKQLLHDHRIPYDWVDIDADPGAAAFVREKNDGRQIIPTIVFPDGSFLVEPSNDELARKLGLVVRASKEAYDLIIVGAGPAGLTAGMYAAREGLDALVLDGSGLGGNVAKIGRVENYPGFPDGVGGADLADRLVAHARGCGVELLPAATVGAIRRDRGGLRVVTGRDDEYRARAVLIATGSHYRRLGAPGEERLIGRGVHFCSICDGPFYKGAQEIVVVGGGNAGLQEALALSRFAGRVRIIESLPHLTASQTLRDRVVGNPRFAVHTNTEVLRFEGEKKLAAVVVKDRASGEETAYRPAAAFVLIGLEPSTSFLGGSVDLDAGGYVITDGDFQTCLRGLFAAGDVRSGSTKQIGSAMGEAISAVLKIRRYLEDGAEGVSRPPGLRGKAMGKRPAGMRRISEEAVRAKTGRGWQEWFAVLDAWDAGAKGHTASARHLREAHGIGPWWAQAVTIRYEYERGLRVP